MRCDPHSMFGGYGLYYGGQFSWILHKGRLYFGTDDRTRSIYSKHGMKPFRPNRKQTPKNYCEVPVEIIEDQEQLTEWAMQAARSTPMAVARIATVRT